MVVTIFMIFDGLTPHDAIPLSKSVVFLGTIFSTILNVISSKLKDKDGKEQGSLVDGDIVLVVVPGALVGTLLGVSLNHVTPAEVLLVVLFITLILTCYLCGSKFLEQRKEESEAQMEVDNPEESGHLIESNDESRSSGSQTRPRPPEVQLGMIVLLFGLEVVTIAGSTLTRLSLDCLEVKKKGRFEECESNLLRALYGDKHDHADNGWFTDHSTPKAIIAAIMPGVIAVVCAAFLLYAVFQANTLSAVHSRGKLLGFASIGLLAGVLAGLVGVGGGLIFAPAFLSMGIDPSVTVATSTFCILFTSSSTTCQYLFLGRIILQLVPAYAITNIVASLLGTTLVLSATAYQIPKSNITALVLFAVTISAIFSVLKILTLKPDGTLSSTVAAVANEDDETTEKLHEVTVDSLIQSHLNAATMVPRAVQAVRAAARRAT
jgi:uncharacterized membrane protein YfcA